MEINDLAIPTTARMRVKDRYGELTNVYISGHTPDSKQWRQAARKHGPKGQDTLSMRVQKKGGNTVELPNDPNAYENRIKHMAAIVTNIEGLTDDGNPWVFSPDAVLKLFSNDGWAYIVEQWEDFMDNYHKFLEDAETTVNSGSSVSAGSTDTKIVSGLSSPDLNLTSNG